MNVCMWDKSQKWTLCMVSGDQSQGAASPVPLKKNVENMEKGKESVLFASFWLKESYIITRRVLTISSFPPFYSHCRHLTSAPAEELQKVLLEQIDFRRRLEQEFHALKGTSPFPVFREYFSLSYEGQRLLPRHVFPTFLLRTCLCFPLSSILPPPCFYSTLIFIRSIYPDRLCKS